MEEKRGLLLFKICKGASFQKEAPFFYIRSISSDDIHTGKPRFDAPFRGVLDMLYQLT